MCACVHGGTCTEVRELLMGIVWGVLGTKLRFLGLVVQAFTLEPSGQPTFEIVFRCS